MRVGRLDHLVLTVSDIERSCSFYQTVLGLEIVSFGDNRTAIRVGGQKINLHAAGHEVQPCAKLPTPGSADLCFLSGDPSEQWYAHLSRCGVALEVGPVRRTGAVGEMTSLYVRDPDGNLIEIGLCDRELL